MSGPLMRSIHSIAALLACITAAAQGSSTGAPVADVMPAGPGGGLTVRSGTAASFAPGDPIPPISMRAVTWEFGDGSLSHILPPQRWTPRAEHLVIQACMAPKREEHGGSPCVAAGLVAPMNEASGEPRPYVMVQADQPVLITTGLGARRLAVEWADPIQAGSVPVNGQLFSSGRWWIGNASEHAGATFIVLRDLASGERWLTWPGF